MTRVDPFKIIGISVKTSNKDNRSSKDIGDLWAQFYKDKLLQKIPNQLSKDIYSIYTDYASDYLGDYTAIIGLKVSSLDVIPQGLIGRQFSGDYFTVVTAKGKMPDAVVNAWMEIWQRGDSLRRKYTYDFEVYDEKSQNGDQSEVKIYVAADKME
jgi:predicted transcriptional regulator YdeE